MLLGVIFGWFVVDNQTVNLIFWYVDFYWLRLLMF
jgi:hypothetical protein